LAKIAENCVHNIDPRSPWTDDESCEPKLVLWKSRSTLPRLFHSFACLSKIRLDFCQCIWARSKKWSLLIKMPKRLFLRLVFSSN
jgi:hypothetical protein